MNNNNLVGKVFEDASGNIVSVNTVDGTIAHLDSGQRVAVERLLDSSFYNEAIDPNIFSNRENNVYTFLGEQIRSIDTNNVGDIDTGVQLKGINTVVESHSDAQRSLSGEYNPSHDEYEEIEAKKREMMQNAANISNTVASSNNKLKELIGEEGVDEIPINRNLEGVTVEGSGKAIEPRETSVTMFDENNVPISSYNQNTVQPKKEDPIYTMFSQVKRSTNFSLNVKLVEKIPRKDFLKMWEESYEVSIIDYLVDEFTEKLLKDPTMIKDQLKAALNTHIYGKPKTTSKPKTTRAKK